jgi:hypothetical protein
MREWLLLDPPDAALQKGLILRRLHTVLHGLVGISEKAA